MTLRQATIRWLDDQSHLRAPTQEGYGYILKKLWRVFGADSPVRVLTPQRVEDWMRKERAKLKPSTYMLQLNVLRLFIRYLCGHGLLRRDSTKGVRVVRLPAPTPRVLGDDEERRLLEVASPVLKAFVIVAVETGLRKRAMLSMEWEHVDMERGRIELPGELLKSHRPLRVPLSQRAWDTLREWKLAVPEGRVFPIAATTLFDLWQPACLAVGLRGLKIHDLRRTFLTRCRQRGVNLEVAMALSDHHDVRTALQAYRLVDEDEMLKAVQRSPQVWAVKTVVGIPITKGQEE